MNTFYDDYYDTIMFVPVAACRLAADTVQIMAGLHVEHRWVRFSEIGQYLVWRQQFECVKMLDDALTGKTPFSRFHELRIHP